MALAVSASKRHDDATEQLEEHTATDTAEQLAESDSCITFGNDKGLMDALTHACRIGVRLDPEQFNTLMDLLADMQIAGAVSTKVRELLRRPTPATAETAPQLFALDGDDNIDPFT